MKGGEKDGFKFFYGRNPTVGTGNLKEQIVVYNKFVQNMNTRNIMKETSTPGDQFDPLLLYSKG